MFPVGTPMVLSSPQRRILESTRNTVSLAKSKLSVLQQTIDERLSAALAKNAELHAELMGTKERLRATEERLHATEEHTKAATRASSSEIEAIRQEAAICARRAHAAEDKMQQLAAREQALLERSMALERRATQAEEAVKSLAHQAEIRAALSNAALEAEVDNRRALERSLAAELAADQY